MEKRNFGASDLRTSAIGFGTWPIGGTFVKEGYGGVDDQQAVDGGSAAEDVSGGAGAHPPEAAAGMA